MTQSELLQEFKQLSIREQLEMLRAALEIIETNYEESIKQSRQKSTLPDSVNSEDPLLSLAGVFEHSSSNISRHHDKYIGRNIRDDHNE